MIANYKIMPFGKYKGQYISLINDLAYFRWLIDTKRLHPKLRIEILNKLK